MEERYLEIEHSLNKKFHKTIFVPFVRALNEYQMINAGDKIAVCISGGKDSMLLAKCMQILSRHSKVPFDLVFLVMNPGYNQNNLQKIKDNAKLLNIPITIFESNIFEAVENIEKSPCYLCARMRRGYLYANAQKLGCNKIALGHHFNDVIETTLLSVLYGAEFKAMMPKLKSTNFKNMELIRPLFLVKEDDIIKWANYNSLEFIRCACKFTEKAEDKESASKRKEIKSLIANLKTKNNNVDINIFRSLHNVNADTLIGHRYKNKTFDFLKEYNKKD